MSQHGWLHAGTGFLCIYPLLVDEQRSKDTLEDIGSNAAAERQTSRVVKLKVDAAVDPAASCLLRGVRKAPERSARYTREWPLRESGVAIGAACESGRRSEYFAQYQTGCTAECAVPGG